LMHAEAKSEAVTLVEDSLPWNRRRGKRRVRRSSL